MPSTLGRARCHVSPPLSATILPTCAARLLNSSSRVCTSVWMSSEALLVSSDSLPTFRTVSEADDVVVIPQSPNTQYLAVLHPFLRLVLSEAATRRLTARPISEASRHCPKRPSSLPKIFATALQIASKTVAG